MSARDILKRIINELVDYKKDVSFKTTSFDEVKKIIAILRYDYVATFHVGDIIYSFDESTQEAIVTPHYLIKKEEYDLTLTKILNKLTEIKKELDKFIDEYDKEKFIHDYLVKNVIYEEAGSISHSMVGPLLYGKGVCEGIAKAAQALFKIAKIESHTVIGDSVSSDNKKTSHSWNVVKIHNKWFINDITFDVTLSKDVIRYDYFNVCFNDVKKSHVPNQIYQKIMSECVSINNYFSINQLIFDDQKTMFCFINKHIKRKKENIYFKTSFPLTASFRKSILNRINNLTMVSEVRMFANENLNICELILKY